MSVVEEKVATCGDSDALASESPEFYLHSHDLRVRIAVPDAVRGYYRATRFDWAGVLCDVHTPYHRYVAPWVDEHDALRHDGLCGPADEFAPIGYAAAAAGGEFLKIGVGILRKPDDEPYDRFVLYPVVSGGERTLRVAPDRAEFGQLLSHGLYGYDYRKEVCLHAAGDGLRLRYSLQNTGTCALTTNVYNHNFWTLDAMPTGVDTLIEFDRMPRGTWRVPYDFVGFSDCGIRFDRDLREDETVFCGDLHFGNVPQQGYRFRLGNRRSGAVVTAVGDGLFTHMVFWACRRVPCLEPYTLLCVQPDEKVEWQIDYTFSEL